MLILKVSVTAGMKIGNAVVEAQRFARFLPANMAVEFDFNGIPVRCHPQADPETVIREYHEDVSRSLEPRKKRWWRLWA